MASDERRIAHCGIDCNECPAFKAQCTQDTELQEKTAAEWSKAYNADIKPEDVYCTSCTTEEGKHFSHCSVCAIRSCGRERGHDNCASCADYACEKLEELFKMVPTARATLDELRRELGPT